MPIESVRFTAYHEAGHYIASRALGAHSNVRLLSVMPAGSQIAGLMAGDFEGTTAASSVQSKLDMIVVLFAGQEAQRFLAPEAEKEIRERAKKDDELAHEILRKLGYHGPSLRHAKLVLRACANAIVRAHWFAVGSLANHLQVYRQLSGAQCEAFVTSLVCHFEARQRVELGGGLAMTSDAWFSDVFCFNGAKLTVCNRCKSVVCPDRFLSFIEREWHARNCRAAH